MKSHKIILNVLFLLVISLNACTPTPQTVLPTATPQPAPTSTEPPAPTATPLPPVLMVGGDIPCYAGPGADYETVATASIGMKMEVLSKDAAGEYWIVKSPAGDGQCWVESRYATIVGEAKDVPILAANAIPTRELHPPQAPKNFGVTATCLVTERGSRRYGQPKNIDKSIFVNFKWSDSANEDGYRIYKDGVLLVELDKDNIEYRETVSNDYGYFPVQSTYSIEAYNSDGSSQHSTITIPIANACKI